MFKYRARAKQLIDFSGLQYGKLMPTDIDGVFEYDDKAVILMEYKYDNAEMSIGQKIAFIRICDDIQKSGKHSTLLFCRHYVENADDDIDAAKATVSDLYYAGKWYKNVNKTVKQTIDDIIRFVNKR